MGTLGLQRVYCTAPSCHITVLTSLYCKFINFCGVYILRISYLCEFHVFQCAVVRLRGVVTFVDMRNASMYYMYLIGSYGRWRCDFTGLLKQRRSELFVF